MNFIPLPKVYNIHRNNNSPIVINIVGYVQVISNDDDEDKIAVLGFTARKASA